MTGHEHNRAVAWVRLWGAVGAAAAMDLNRDPRLHALLHDLFLFERRRYDAAVHALHTTTAALAALETDDVG